MDQNISQILSSRLKTFSHISDTLNNDDGSLRRRKWLALQCKRRYFSKLRLTSGSRKHDDNKRKIHLVNEKGLMSPVVCVCACVVSPVGLQGRISDILKVKALGRHRMNYITTTTTLNITKLQACTEQAGS